MSTTQFDVALALARMEGQLSAVLQFMSSQGDAITNVTSEVTQLRDRVTVLEPIAAVPAEVAGLRDRVTTLEATKSATPPWWIVIGALIPALGFIWLVAEQIFGK